MNPHEHGPVVSSGACRRPDVQVKAIFARRRGLSIELELVVRSLLVAHLHTGAGRRIGAAHPIPSDDGLWWLPSQVADRRCGVRNALKCSDASHVRWNIGDEAA